MENEKGPASGSIGPGRPRKRERQPHLPVREDAPAPLPPALQPRDPHDPDPSFDSSGVSVERLRHEVEQDWYNELHLLAPTAYLLIGFDCTIFQINLAGAELLGIERARCREHRLREFISPPFIPDWTDFLERSLNSGVPLRCMLDLRCRDQVMPVTLVACADGSGQACRVTVERAEGRNAAVEASEERFRRIVHTAQEGIWEIDARARTTFVNPKMAQMLGWTIEEMLHRPLTDFMDEDSRVLAERDLARRRQGLSDRHEFRFLRKDGQSLWTSLATNPIFDNHGDYIGAVALVTDVSERRQGIELAWQSSNFDALTGLPNRPMFMDRLAVEARKADRSAGFLALALINLDHFRDTNQRLGPAIGDALLVQAARRLGSCVRSSDTLARTGGDEFAVVLAGLDHVGSVERIAQSLLNAMARPFDVQGRRQFLSASIGIALYPPDAGGIDDLMRAAAAALETSRADGRNRFSYARPELQQAALSRQAIGQDLRHALEARQFEVWYQPVVALASGKVCKAEALLRWRHPARGLLGPADFLPFAESNGLLAEIGDWVFRQVAQQVQQWQRSIDPAFQVSVNKSPVQFRKDADAYQGWLAYLRQLGLPQNSIVVEITESALMGGAAQVVERLGHYRAMGVQVALDDFGKGYASLAHLQRFAVDYLKIDQSFIAHIEEDDSQLAMVEAIIAMAHKLGVKVVAEGVETRVQRALLLDAGCDYAQGYMFAHPMPAGEFEPVALGTLARLPH